MAYPYAQNRSRYACVAAESSTRERAQFIEKTYSHVALAILTFIVIEAILLNTPFMQILFGALFSASPIVGWAVILFLFIGAPYIAESMARSSTSREMQYMGLFLYVLVEAIIFWPIMYYASEFFPEIIAQAGIITLGLFLGLSIIAFTTTDFTFLGSYLKLGLTVAFFYAIAGILFGFGPSSVFCLLVIVLASGMILYTTSKVLYHYHTDQYVAAALELFAAVALLFWYVMRVLLIIASEG